ncbi:MAG: EAL domain-containing protein [Phyllobacteriaceae bacterium]|nr:EAL domain-containing protein [Phyllobacteriaceae bacterium]
MIGQIGTEHFVELAGGIRFGRSGHAVIVDQMGQVLAHPKDEWVQTAQSLAQLRPISQGLAMGNGVAEFYSPALEADMVAGFSGVRNAGWAVMVPQPLAELKLQAYEALRPIYLILTLGLLLALLLAYGFADRIARPLERITTSARRAHTAGLEEIHDDRGLLVPLEQREIVVAYNGMVRSVRASETQMRRLAYTDGLTGLLNRAAFCALAGSAFETEGGTSNRARGALFYFDVDDFKTVNDTRGHAAGDAVLAGIAERVCGVLRGLFGDLACIDGSLRQIDLTGPDAEAPRPHFARFGGDEFVLLVPGLVTRADIEVFAERIMQAVAAPMAGKAEGLNTRISIGAAAYDMAGADMPADLDQMLQRADVALYHAKTRGKGRMCLYAPEEGVRSIHEIRADIRHAIQSGQMVLHYQPKIHTRSGMVHSVEALVRWNHPQRGLVMPGAFIPAIEDSDEIIALGEWVFRAAAADMLAWQAQGRDLSVAINIAARHYSMPGFASRTVAMARDCGVEPSRITLEITEEAAMRPGEGSDENAGVAIAELKAAGFMVALDDYGCGYSNLQRLAQIKVDAIKIDRSLIAQVNSHARTREIVAATVAMAEALECRVTAEGIEDAAHAATLRRLGCHELQGYYFAHAMDMADCESWLREREHNNTAGLRQLAAALG